MPLYMVSCECESRPSSSQGILRFPKGCDTIRRMHRSLNQLEPRLLGRPHPNVMAPWRVNECAA